MGFNGFVIGPVIAALFMAVWEIFGDAEPHTPRDRTRRSASPTMRSGE
jgi:predicted PurR-regulated permease PerM